MKIAKSVGYINAGTLEFLVDKSGSYYFIEMNPRIQVEHTVTEMVTGIDLVRAQILIAEGYPLSHPAIGLNSQDDVQVRGYAIQCRVTTEDPTNNFAPDNGKITSYRTGGGNGVRLDGGNATTGTVISPYYDSLLVKVTCWDNSFQGTCRKALRAISEVRVRGVKTNIPFVSNILSHPTFVAGKCHTKFIDETPELFDITDSKDRATRVLKYIANIQVANPNAERKQYDTPRFPKGSGQPKPALKQLLDEKAPRRCPSGSWSEEAADYRYHHAGRPSVPAVHQNAYPRHGQGRRRHGGYSGGLLLSGDVGRRNLRRCLPVPA